MNVFRILLSAVVLALALQLVPAARAEGPTKDLLELNRDLVQRLTPQFGSGDQVSAAPQQGRGRPGPGHHHPTR